MVKSLLDSLLGGVKDLTGGQSAGQMAGKARAAWDGQSTLTKGAVAGGLLAVLLSGNARRLVGTGAKIGGAALIGGLAFKAYEDWKKGKSAAEVADDGPLALRCSSRSCGWASPACRGQARRSSSPRLIANLMARGRMPQLCAHSARKAGSRPSICNRSPTTPCPASTTNRTWPR
jgi:uncharacterized membrane protein YebE (DUF533 family)